MPPAAHARSSTPSRTIEARFTPVLVPNRSEANASEELRAEGRESGYEKLLERIREMLLHQGVRSRLAAHRRRGIHG